MNKMQTKLQHMCENRPVNPINKPAHVWYILKCYRFWSVISQREVLQTVCKQSVIKQTGSLCIWEMMLCCNDVCDLQVLRGAGRHHVCSVSSGSSAHSCGVCRLLQLHLQPRKEPGSGRNISTVCLQDHLWCRGKHGCHSFYSVDAICLLIQTFVFAIALIMF